MPKRTPDHMRAQRERILRATIRCIGDLGLDKTSIAAIRNEAELSTGAIYKHFSGKAEIVAAALEFAAMDQSDIPHEWPLLRDDMATLKEEHGFDVTTIAKTNLQLLGSSLQPGPLRDLLRPQMEHSLTILAERLAAMAQAGEIRLKMSPLRTAKCLAALADGLTWFGLASGRGPEAISEDIAAGLECLVEPCSPTASDE
jgi:AcrR family transcriptional regulator